MKSIEQWLAEYGESHKNETNKTIHWICVPTIFFSVVGLLYGIKLPWAVSGIQVNLAMIIMLLVVFYYFSLSKTLWIGIVWCVLFMALPFNRAIGVNTIMDVLLNNFYTCLDRPVLRA